MLRGRDFESALNKALDYGGKAATTYPVGQAAYVPGRFILFSEPSDMPKGQMWIDEGSVRRFSAAFYADLLQDMAVRQVS